MYKIDNTSSKLIFVLFHLRKKWPKFFSIPKILFIVVYSTFGNIIPFKRNLTIYESFFSLFFYRQVPNLELQEKVTLLLSKDHFKYFRKNPLDLLLLLNNVNLINRILDDGLNSSYKITKIFFHNTRVCFEKKCPRIFKKRPM